MATKCMGEARHAKSSKPQMPPPHAHLTLVGLHNVQLRRRRVALRDGVDEGLVLLEGAALRFEGKRRQAHRLDAL